MVTYNAVPASANAPEATLCVSSSGWCVRGVPGIAGGRHEAARRESAVRSASHARGGESN